MKTLLRMVVAGCVLLFFAFRLPDSKPTLYIIGDSTVKNGDGTGANLQWGWGSLIAGYFDTTRISIRNHAIGGRSSRTFITDGRWDAILKTLKSGDYVIMQFGHNDSGPLDDTARARGTIKGIGSDSAETYNPIRKTNETVYSYGWYMRRYIRETKEKGAIPVICSPVPRANRKNDRIVRSDYAVWARQLAEETGSCLIDLQDLVAAAYDKMDSLRVNAYFPTKGDRTHTNKEGATFNAEQVVAGIKQLSRCDLKKFLLR
ncbi:rhamnogalacturonan acetylesterase [Sediminibacterium roseum]|uniref:Rhamnogalacturonan acetylesterase n=1 Tax=Sediminibacterium roseum TaxID=1978412 RepID=A0ABW9ZTG2_9BACT|nr:rhamnogalacturonan acetylesterase [Sediminibacterium roseum]NCI49702.1 rhamnogalacturonan acetylesterase [Sediminibacterium roseum]